MRDRRVGTLELYYPRFRDIDARRTALATGFADLVSTQLANFELEKQSEVSACMELRALQSQVDPHFLFNTIGTIVSLVRNEPEKARSLLIDFSNYYRQTLSNSDALTSLQNELGQGMRYINLMQARYGEGRLKLAADLDPASLDRQVPPFILQPLLENCIKHAMREVEPLTIRLSSSVEDDRARIVVEDDGIGMDERTRAHLFDPKRSECETPADADALSPRSAAVTADGSIKRGGLALANVLMRIHFFFGEESGIRVESREGVLRVRRRGVRPGCGRLRAQARRAGPARQGARTAPAGGACRAGEPRGGRGRRQALLHARGEYRLLRGARRLHDRLHPDRFVPGVRLHLRTRAAARPVGLSARAPQLSGEHRRRV